jgi:hypothetical protein
MMDRSQRAFVIALSIAICLSGDAWSGPIDKLSDNLYDLSSWKNETEGLALKVRDTKSSTRGAAEIRYRSAQQAANGLFDRIAADIQHKNDLSIEDYRDTLAKCEREVENFRSFVEGQLDLPRTKTVVSNNKKIELVAPLLAVVENSREIGRDDSKEQEVIRKALHGLRLRDFERI